jgi:hypothetical protein
MVSDWKGESFSFMAHVESGKNRLANHFFDLRHRQTWLLSSEDWQWRGQRLLRLVSFITSSYAASSRDVSNVFCVCFSCFNLLVV